MSEPQQRSIGFCGFGKPSIVEMASRSFCIRLIIAANLGFILVCNVARADWAVVGAQYSCQSHMRLFEISPYSTWSGLGDVPEHTPLKSRFRLVMSGVPISCKIAGHTIRTTLKIISPYEGNGMGGGRVDIESMKVGGVELLSGTESLDWDVLGARDTLIRVRVAAIEGALSIERCYGAISLADNEVGKEIIDHCDNKAIMAHPAEMLKK